MSFHRRFLLGAVAGACGGSTPGLASTGAFASDQSGKLAERPARFVLNAADVGVLTDLASDQTLTLQKAINLAAESKVPLQLQPGRYVCCGFKIHPSLGYKV